MRGRLVLLKLQDENTATGQKYGLPITDKIPQSPQEKIQLFLRLFRCRENVYPKLWENLKQNSKGYSPVCSNEWRHGISLKSYDRFFPNQDYIPKGGFGNLIALPLQKQPREDGNTVFLDDKLLPYEDQWKYLSETRCLSSLDLDCLNRKYFPGLSRDNVKDERDFSLRSDERIIEDESEKTRPVKFESPVEITINSHLSIPLLDLPSRLVMALKRTANIPNPKFYELQRMRMSTYPHPLCVAEQQRLCLLQCLI